MFGVDMPKRTATAQIINLDVLDKVAMWGKCVRIQRVKQRILADDFCRRIFVSRPTLRRLEQGDPGVSATTYLAALNVLGLLNVAAPDIDPALYQGNQAIRARLPTGFDDDF
ncbi:helix-turn-helix domain-containing protein [Castellaniella caeni]|uniref:helix-turn-helix domain-containing protein n=1 Tax=Castellaniella caeni TaxID=266123 RepID=UPI0008298E5C|nr:helix-turn-helix transcriptional regulator [Castellaniella caeni]